MTREDALEQIDALEQSIEEAERTIAYSLNPQAVEAAYELIRRCQKAIDQLSRYL